MNKLYKDYLFYTTALEECILAMRDFLLENQSRVNWKSYSGSISSPAKSTVWCTEQLPDSAIGYTKINELTLEKDRFSLLTVVINGEKYYGVNNTTIAALYKHAVENINADV